MQPGRSSEAKGGVGERERRNKAEPEEENERKEWRHGAEAGIRGGVEH
jgi:hypothetical protein